MKISPPVFFIFIFFVCLFYSHGLAAETNGAPNVILIMTDDQGIGDFGFTGNPYVQTPHLDKLASQSLNLTNFYVSPVCAPTRACLMTGRYSERTGVYDTYNGRATMSTDEITMAEVLKENGYNTGHESGIEDFELFNVHEDVQEKDNIVADKPDLASSLKTEIDDWYDEIIREENNNKSFPAYMGTKYENPVILNRNDAKGTPVSWSGESRLNYWDLRVVEDGLYDIRYHFVKPTEEPGKVCLNLYPYNMDENCDQSGIKNWTFKNVKVKKGDYRLEPYMQSKEGKYIFPFYVSVERVDQ